MKPQEMLLYMAEPRSKRQLAEAMSVTTRTVNRYLAELKGSIRIEHYAPMPGEKYPVAFWVAGNGPSARRKGRPKPRSHEYRERQEAGVGTSDGMFRDPLTIGLFGRAK